MALKLSVLIPTTSARNKVIQPLIKELYRQMKDKAVELIINDHETHNVGKKRNNLLAQAQGEWVVFVDSDDMISKDYITKILRATESNPDCIGISGIITTNGRNAMQWHISKDYGSWYRRGRQYFRTPNHISPVRRSIAIKAGFPEITTGEDYEYSMRILPFLQTEVIIKGNLYFYKYIKNKK